MYFPIFKLHGFRGSQKWACCKTFVLQQALCVGTCYAKMGFRASARTFFWASASARFLPRVVK